MSQFPTLCVDNFYTNPNIIREFALQQDFQSSPTGQWPGKRTLDLFQINPELMQKFCQRLFSFYFDLEYTKIRWKVTSKFQIIEPYGIESYKNKGWIHFDNAVFGGVIYLNPNPNLDSGTSLYEIIDPLKYDKDQQAKHSLYLTNTTSDNYENQMKEQDSNFLETIKFSNRYNRMISFDSAVPHRADNFIIDNEPRLTQIFFVEDLQSNRPISSNRFII